MSATARANVPEVSAELLLAAVDFSQRSSDLFRTVVGVADRKKKWI